MFLDLVGTAWAAQSVVPLAAPITLLVASVQSAGGGFVALKCCWLGVTWRRGMEHGMDEFSAIGISAALLVGAQVIGAAVAGAGGMPLVPVLAGYAPLNELVGDLAGSLGYLGALLGPGLYVRRRQLRGAWARLRRWGR